MITKKIKIILFLCFLFIVHPNSTAQKNNKPINRILFVFDASQSMLGYWQSGRKIDIAKDLLINMIDSLKDIENLEIGLRVYGHKSIYPPQDCEDTHLELGFLKANDAADIIKKKLATIKSRGTTPIARSLEEGAKDFPSKKARNIVILITDGKEECDMDPCAVSRLYQRERIILKPFVIGVGLDKSWKESFDCIGRFFDASEEEDIKDILNLVISHVIDNTTTQVNLLDNNGEATETNVNITFYDQFTETSKYNYLHTMNHLGLPDTMIIDPILSYDVVAHTIPPVILKDVVIQPGEHNIVSLNVPQGKLEIKMNSKIKYEFLVSSTKDKKILNVQSINEEEKYLIGKYNIELLTLPRYKLNDVEIAPNETTVYSIPTPGYINIKLPSKGYGGVYVNKNDILQKIYSFKGKNKSYQLALLPGKYKVVFRRSNSNTYIDSIEKNFKISSGKSQSIKIY